MSDGSGSRNLNLTSPLPLFLVSSSTILFELSLMRSLSYLKFSHFSYLVISIALLGFCASGTAISLYRKYFLIKGEGILPLLLIFQAFSFSLCYPASWELAPDSFFFLSPGVGSFTLFPYLLLLFLPFFIAGLIIGLILLIYGRSTGLLYGMNLLGSGVGGGFALVLMSRMDPLFIPFTAVIPAAGAALVWIGSSERGLKRIALSMVSLIPLITVIIPVFLTDIRPEIDQYKAGAYIKELEKQDLAEQISRSPGVRGMIECYASDTFHDTLFAGLNNPYMPPSQIAILVDGNMAGTLFTSFNPGDDRILEYTPQSIPYSLFEKPRVLLLGETGGTNIRLARRMGAAHITVVHPDRSMIGLLLGDLKDLGGKVFSGNDIDIVISDPRSFLDLTGEKFDIIHISQAEGMPASSGGIYSLKENFLLTVEGVGGALEVLNEGGILSVVRGRQIPPRDSIRIFSTFHAALEAGGYTLPENKQLMMQNYLASLNMVSNIPFTGERIDSLLVAAEKSGCDWAFPPGDADGALIEGNIFDISPPTDSKPYFHHFFKLKSLKWVIDNYAALYLFHAELGYLTLLTVFFLVLTLSIVLLLIPFLSLRKAGAGGSAGRSAAFFLLIGFGFMFFEMVCIKRLSLFIGDPLISISVVIIFILIFSGAGSVVQSRSNRPVRFRIIFASAVLSALMLLYLFYLDEIFDLVTSPGLASRYFLSILILLPPSFFMGWFFAPGLELLHQTDRRLVPLAWGVNGAASVTAAPLATLLMMSFGSVTVASISLILYVCVIPALILQGKKRPPLPE